MKEQSSRTMNLKLNALATKQWPWIPVKCVSCRFKSDHKRAGKGSIWTCFCQTQTSKILNISIYEYIMSLKEYCPNDQSHHLLTEQLQRNEWNEEIVNSLCTDLKARARGRRKHFFCVGCWSEEEWHVQSGRVLTGGSDDLRVLDVFSSSCFSSSKLWSWRTANPQRRRIFRGGSGGYVGADRIMFWEALSCDSSLGASRRTRTFSLSLSAPEIVTVWNSFLHWNVRNQF